MGAFHRREKLEGHTPAGKQGQGDGEHDHAQRQGGVAPLDGTLHCRLVIAGGECLQRIGNPALESQPAVLQGTAAADDRFGLAVGQVGGQDQL